MRCQRPSDTWKEAKVWGNFSTYTACICAKLLPDTCSILGSKAPDRASFKNLTSLSIFRIHRGPPCTNHAALRYGGRQKVEGVLAAVKF